jgi:hypothetical protein
MAKRLTAENAENAERRTREGKRRRIFHPAAGFGPDWLRSARAGLL